MKAEWKNKDFVNALEKYISRKNKEILLGATGGRDKLGLGIVEENAWGEPQPKGRRDDLCDEALWVDRLLMQRY